MHAFVAGIDRPAGFDAHREQESIEDPNDIPSAVGLQIRSVLARFSGLRTQLRRSDPTSEAQMNYPLLSMLSAPSIIAAAEKSLIRNAETPFELKETRKRASGRRKNTDPDTV